MKEIWKDIKDFEGLYQISNMGRVKSLGNGKTRKEKILSGGNCTGYYYVHLCKEGKRKHYYFHRLVAEAFIPNPLNYPEVEHIDCNPNNNTVDNLRWCTHKENCNNPLTISNYKQSNTYGHCKPIIQIMSNGTTKEWLSAAEVERVLGYNQSNISACCRGKYKTAYGYKWSFKSPI
jgi:hypothetical protein